MAHSHHIVRSAVVAAALAVVFLGLGVLSGGVEASWAACAHARGEPREISTREARRAVLCLVNEERADRGLRKVDSSTDLRSASLRHSRYMKEHGCFDHECPGEPSLVGRLRSVGYLLSSLSAWACAENIAWGEGSRGTPRAIVKAWMNSPPHRAAMLDPSWEHGGVGVVWGSPYDPDDRAGIFTLDFGYRSG